MKTEHKYFGIITTVAIIAVVVIVCLVLQGCAVGFYARIGDQRIDLSNISAESETKAKIDETGLLIGD